MLADACCLFELRYPYYQQGMAQYAAPNGGQGAMYGAPPPYQNQMLGLRNKKMKR